MNYLEGKYTDNDLNEWLINRLDSFIQDYHTYGSLTVHQQRVINEGYPGGYEVFKENYKINNFNRDTHLHSQSKETIKMSNLSDTFLAENKDFKYVSIVFDSTTTNKEYIYKTLLEIKENDFAIVITPSNQFQVVRVTAVIDPLEFNSSTEVEYKWIVQILDTSAYDKCVEMEHQISKNLKRAEIRKRQEELRESAKKFLHEDERNAVTKLVKL